MDQELLAEMRAKFGPSDGDGRFLLGMVDTHPDTSVNSAYGRLVLCLRRAVKDLALGSVTDRDLCDGDGFLAATVQGGITLAVAAVLTTERRESISRVRPPTPAEKHHWLARSASSDAADVGPREPSADQWTALGFRTDEVSQWRSVAPRLVLDSDDEYDTDAAGPTDETLLRVAVTWQVCGFSVEEACEWSQAMDPTPGALARAHMAREWRERGFALREARAWHAQWPGPQEAPEAARHLRDLGWRPFEVWMLDIFIDAARNPDRRLARRQFTAMRPEHALDMARAGMAADDYFDQMFFDTDEASWDHALRSAYQVRTPIDPYYAMHLNQEVFISYGEEIPDDVPFRLEHTWDLNNAEIERALDAGEPPALGVPLVAKPTGAVDTVPSELCAGSSEGGLPVKSDRHRGAGAWADLRTGCRRCDAKWFGVSLERLPDHRPVRSGTLFGLERT